MSCEGHGEHFTITTRGKASGGEFRLAKRYGPFFPWSVELKV